MNTSVIFPSQEESYKLNCRKANNFLNYNGEETINFPFVQITKYAHGEISLTTVYSTNHLGTELFIRQPDSSDVEEKLKIMLDDLKEYYFYGGL